MKIHAALLYHKGTFLSTRKKERAKAETNSLKRIEIVLRFCYTYIVSS